MPDFMEIKCPECGSTLFINRSTGKVAEVRRAVDGQAPGEDRFEALVRKAKGRGDALEEKFRQAREREKNKFDRLDSLFKDASERARQQGDIGPDVRDIDLD